jgi:peptidoglycan/xylan/chitin deacetylase (PgdA/CDA1 family)
VYHRIVNDDASLKDIPASARPYCLSKGRFIEHLDYLLNRGYRGIAVSEVFGISEKHAVGITFDDGLESDYVISFPELNKRGFRATFYIITARVGKRGYMSWDQIKEMKRSGQEIGSHSVTHPCLTDIDRHKLFRELTQSKNEIEEHLGEPIESFGIPYGFVNRNVVEAIIEAGYTSICTSKTALADPKTIPKVYGRYGIRRGDSMKTFKGIIERQALTLLKVNLKEEGKNFLKRFMGRQVWLVFREKILSSRLF